MYSAFQPSNLGDEMPKKGKKEGRWFYIWLGILFLLMLKAFKVLPDPPQYAEMAASIGAAIGIISSLAFFFNHMLKFEHRLTKLEDKFTTVEVDLKAIKVKLEVS